MTPPVTGIHHITAVAGDPRRNLDFYTGVLGLRLVKRTVNFDDPGVHHLYYADREGTPGTVLTFFPWPRARRGRPGLGQVGSVSFSVPEDALDYWTGRLRRAGVEVEGTGERLGERVVRFADPDGLPLELVAGGPGGGARPWEEAPVPPERALRGFHGATLLVGDPGPPAEFLRSTLGLEPAGRDGGRRRFRAPGSGAGRVVDLRTAPELGPGRPSAGTVHHLAWRAGSEAEQDAWRERLLEAGLEPTPPRDRHYFRSIYFRAPGGFLFEMATGSPGFTADEPVEELGSGLRLPPWLEDRRQELEARLPDLGASGGSGRPEGSS